MNHESENRGRIGWQEVHTFVDNSSTREVVARILRLEERVRQLEEESTTDHLTGLPNRKGLLLALEREMRKERRDRRPAALVFQDLDGFKGVNDRLGHAMGDAVLQTYAEIIVRLTRPDDTSTRIGGDEFVTILDGVTAEQAQRVFQRVAEGVPHVMQDIFEGPCPIGVSFGVVDIDPNKSAEQIMAEADQLMYSHKQSKGNNRR